MWMRGRNMAVDGTLASFRESLRRVTSITTWGDPWMPFLCYEQITSVTNVHWLKSKEAENAVQHVERSVFISCVMYFSPLHSNESEIWCLLYFRSTLFCVLWYTIIGKEVKFLAKFLYTVQNERTGCNDCLLVFKIIWMVKKLKTSL